MPTTTTTLSQRVSELPWPALHDVAFPFQVLAVLSEQGTDYEGGESVLLEQHHLPRRRMKTYTLIGADGQPHASTVPGTLGGHRGSRVYGRLDCAGALRWIARGHYVAQRVFFADETTAVAAGYRPCAGCLPDQYQAWKHRRTTMLFTTYDAPMGALVISGDEAGTLSGLRFDDPAAVPPSWRRDDAAFAGVRAQLDEYFGGARETFDVALRLDGSAFERRVWDALRAIPHGTTTTYGALAERLDAPKGARAVGLANSRNRVAIIVPCHRVIGARGALTGYAGGLDRKRALLAHEGALLAV
jgi:methylated-DNA-[protein]-cysteine S-methyltransferase